MCRNCLVLREALDDPCSSAKLFFVHPKPQHFDTPAWIGCKVHQCKAQNAWYLGIFKPFARAMVSWFWDETEDVVGTTTVQPRCTLDIVPAWSLRPVQRLQSLFSKMGFKIWAVWHSENLHTFFNRQQQNKQLGICGIYTYTYSILFLNTVNDSIKRYTFVLSFHPYFNTFDRFWCICIATFELHWITVFPIFCHLCFHQFLQASGQRLVCETSADLFLWMHDFWCKLPTPCKKAFWVDALKQFQLIAVFRLFFRKVNGRVISVTQRNLIHTISMTVQEFCYQH